MSHSEEHKNDGDEDASDKGWDSRDSRDFDGTPPPRDPVSAVIPPKKSEGSQNIVSDWRSRNVEDNLVSDWRSRNVEGASSAASRRTVNVVLGNFLLILLHLLHSYFGGICFVLQEVAKDRMQGSEAAVKDHTSVYDNESPRPDDKGKGRGRQGSSSRQSSPKRSRRTRGKKKKHRRRSRSSSSDRSSSRSRSRSRGTRRSRRRGHKHCRHRHSSASSHRSHRSFHSHYSHRSCRHHAHHSDRGPKDGHTTRPGLQEQRDLLGSHLAGAFTAPAYLQQSTVLPGPSPSTVPNMHVPVLNPPPSRTVWQQLPTETLPKNVEDKGVQVEI